MTIAAPTRSAGTTGRVGGVEYVVYGDGEPVTVFAHGLAGSISEIKPLAMPLAGTRVLFHFRGHGASDALSDGWDYDLLAADLLNVVDAFAASNVCGLSLGSGAILRVLASDPQRFDRLGFVMPAILDSPRTDAAIGRLERLGAAIESGDRAAITGLLFEEVPSHLHADRVTQILLARRASELLALTPPAPRGVDVPITDRSELRKVIAPAVVISQRDDRLHPVSIAAQLANALGNAELTELEPGGVFWTQLDQTRDLLKKHFAN